MPINVTCSGCRTRFTVSEKFAGKRGPCPKCKQEIRVPTLDEQVVVHSPETEGPKDAEGRLVLKPIARQETRLSPIMWVVIGSSVAVVLFAALIVRLNGPPPAALLAVGAIVLAPPLVLAGYSFLRNDELAAYEGQSLWIRTAICSAVYPLLWLGYVYGPGLLNFSRDELELFHYAFLIPPLFVAGATASWSTLDLDYGSAFIHYGLYALVTGGLALFVGVAVFT